MAFIRASTFFVAALLVALAVEGAPHSERGPQARTAVARGDARASACFFPPALWRIPTGTTQYLCCVGMNATATRNANIVGQLQGSSYDLYAVWGMMSGDRFAGCPPGPPSVADEPRDYGDALAHPYGAGFTAPETWPSYTVALAIRCVAPFGGSPTCNVSVWAQMAQAPLLSGRADPLLLERA
jgi:hypothetical protein